MIDKDRAVNAMGSTINDLRLLGFVVKLFLTAVAIATPATVIFTYPLIAFALYYDFGIVGVEWVVASVVSYPFTVSVILLVKNYFGVELVE